MYYKIFFIYLKYEKNNFIFSFSIYTNIYKRGNSIESSDTRMDHETIEEYKKSLNFQKKMNIYYRNIGTNHEWVYDKKMENFSSSEFCFSSNYIY